MKSIILASASPRRKKLLELINLPFEVIPSPVGEAFDPNLSPAEIVETLALRKAKDVASGKAGKLVIGADTIVVFEEEILEKPESPEHAVEMLQRLSGDTHQVFTGVALVKTGSEGNIQEICTFAERTDVVFGELDPEDIKGYVDSGSPMDKAGAYGIQDDLGALFVKGIEGDYYTVVGFPLYAFYQKMKQFAPEYLHESKQELKN